jgi:prepilin-type N-terminal cleavage/methylation domain-containing protein
MSRRRHQQRGFTLVELGVVLGIIAVLATLSIAGLIGLRKRSSISTAFEEVQTGLLRARSQAFARGTRTVFVVDSKGGRWWALVEDPDAPFDLTEFAKKPQGTIIDRGELGTTVAFGPEAGYGKDLPAPFTGIPVTSASPKSCSFCDPDKGWGAIYFLSSGAVTFTSPSGGAGALGQQFSLHGTYEGASRTMLFAVVARTGVIQTFEED